MVRITRISVVLAFIIVGLGFAAGIDGKWKGNIKTPQGEMEIIYNFQVSGDSLTGTFEGPMGEMPISNGKIKDNEFSFDVTMGPRTRTNHCTVSGDSLFMRMPGRPDESGQPTERKATFLRVLENNLKTE